MEMHEVGIHAQLTAVKIENVDDTLCISWVERAGFAKKVLIPDNVKFRLASGPDRAFSYNKSGSFIDIFHKV